MEQGKTEYFRKNIISKFTRHKEAYQLRFICVRKCRQLDHLKEKSLLKE